MEEKKTKKDVSDVIAKISLFGISLLVIGIIWLICVVTKTGIYEPAKPYMFSPNSEPINAVFDEKDGDNDFMYLIFSVNVSGKDLDKVYYSFGDKKPNEPKTEIIGEKTENKGIVTIDSKIIEIPVLKETLDTLQDNENYKCFIEAEDKNGEIVIIKEILLK